MAKSEVLELLKSLQAQVEGQTIALQQMMQQYIARSMKMEVPKIQMLADKQSKVHQLDDQQIAKLQTRSVLQRSLAELGVSNGIMKETSSSSILPEGKGCKQMDVAQAAVKQWSNSRVDPSLSCGITSGVGTNKEPFDGLANTRDRLEISSSIIFGWLIRVFCDLKKPTETFEFFYMLKAKQILPQIEPCTDLLSLFLQLNKTETAWIIYAEMFRFKINSSLFTFNIVINVLCQQGQLIRAIEFISYMDNLGFKPLAVTVNIIFHGYCTRGNIQGAHKVFNKMQFQGINSALYPHASLISGLCKKGKVIAEVQRGIKPLLFLLHGLNTDSNNFPHPTEFEGVEQFATDLGTLHPILTECCVVKSDLEIALLPFANDLVGDVDDMMVKRLGAVFLGNDTHDPGGYLKGAERPKVHGLRALRTSRELNGYCNTGEIETAFTY